MHFFVLLFFLAITKIVDNAINKDTWEYGEWLINYQNGFNRRGLIGELIFFISRLLGKNIQLSFIILVSIIVFVFYYLNYNGSAERKRKTRLQIITRKVVWFLKLFQHYFRKTQYSSEL